MPLVVLGRGVSEAEVKANMETSAWSSRPVCCLTLALSLRGAGFNVALRDHEAQVA